MVQGIFSLSVRMARRLLPFSAPPSRCSDLSMPAVLRSAFFQHPEQLPVLEQHLHPTWDAYQNPTVVSAFHGILERLSLRVALDADGVGLARSPNALGLKVFARNGRRKCAAPQRTHSWPPEYLVANVGPEFLQKIYGYGEGYLLRRTGQSVDHHIASDGCPGCGDRRRAIVAG
jgi:hypothetical protein